MTPKSLFPLAPSHFNFSNPRSVLLMRVFFEETRKQRERFFFISQETEMLLGKIHDDNRETNE